MAVRRRRRRCGDDDGWRGLHCRLSDFNFHIRPRYTDANKPKSKLESCQANQTSTKEFKLRSVSIGAAFSNAKSYRGPCLHTQMTRSKARATYVDIQVWGNHHSFASSKYQELRPHPRVSRTAPSSASSKPQESCVLPRTSCQMAAQRLRQQPHLKVSAPRFKSRAKIRGTHVNGLFQGNSPFPPLKSDLCSKLLARRPLQDALHYVLGCMRAQWRLHSLHFKTRCVVS